MVVIGSVMEHPGGHRIAAVYRDVLLLLKVLVLHWIARKIVRMRMVVLPIQAFPKQMSAIQRLVVLKTLMILGFVTHLLGAMNVTGPLMAAHAAGSIKVLAVAHLAVPGDRLISDGELTDLHIR